MDRERAHITISSESQQQEYVLLEEMEIVVQQHTQGTVFLQCNDNSSHALSVNALPYSHAHIIVLVQGSRSITYRSTLAEHARIHWHIITWASHDAHHDLISECKGDDAVSIIDWVFLARNKDVMEISVQNVFLGKRGSGEVTMKGVAEGKGNVKAKGLIKIGPEGSQTNTYLTEDVLMLDPTAKVDAIPALEIKTNDVKASHSATVSRVTEEDLFYFAARGIDKEIARGMYVDGFLRELIEAIPEESMVRTIGNIIFSM